MGTSLTPRVDASLCGYRQAHRRPICAAVTRAEYAGKLALSDYSHVDIIAGPHGDLDVIGADNKSVHRGIAHLGPSRSGVGAAEQAIAPCISEQPVPIYGVTGEVSCCTTRESCSAPARYFSPSITGIGTSPDACLCTVSRSIH